MAADDRGSVSAPLVSRYRFALDPLDRRRARAEALFRLFGDELDHARVGRYVLRGRLGAGSWGTVYRAFDPRTRREVAVKVLHESGRHDAKVLNRWRHEARVLAALEHPNTIPVFDIGRHDGRLYLVTELVADARSLTAWIRDSSPAWRQTVRAFLELVDGVAHVHAQGIVHRDIKPDNILVDRDGRLRLADFGLARWADEAHTPQARSSASSGPSGAAGTPAFMAPEARAGLTDARADQYSLCATLWFAVTGACVPDGKPPRRLRGVLRRGLHDDPSRRYASLSDLRRALAGALRRPVLVVAAGLAAFAVLLGPCGSEPPPPCRGAATLHWLDDGPTQGARWHGAAPIVERFRASFAGAADVLCLASTDAQTREAGMRCLERRSAQLNTALWILAHGEPEDGAASGAAEALRRIPSPRSCTDATSPADDAQTRWAVLLARVDTLMIAGHAQEARTLLVDHEALGSPAGLLRWGDIELQLGHSEAGQRALLAAYNRAHATGDDAAALSAAIDLTYAYAGLRWADAEPEQARFWLREVQSRVSLLGRDGVDPARALALAEASNALGARADARRWLDHAVDIANRGSDPDWARSGAAALRGGWSFDEGDYAAAAHQFEAALAHATERVGREAPLTLSLLNNLALALVLAGQLDRAAELQREVLEIRERRWGPDDTRVARALENLASTRVDQGRLREATELQRRATDILERGSDARLTANAMSNLGSMHMMAEDFALAEGTLWKSLVTLEGLDGHGALATVEPLENLSRVALLREEFAEALDYARRAFEATVLHQGADHPSALRRELWLAVVEARHGSLAGGVVRAQRVVATLEAREQRLPELESRARIRAAELALDTDDVVGAREHAEASVALLQGAELNPAILAQALFVYGRALDRPPDRDPIRARAYVTRAIRTIEDVDGQNNEVAQMQSWIDRRPPRGGPRPADSRFSDPAGQGAGAR